MSQEPALRLSVEAAVSATRSREARENIDEVSKRAQESGAGGVQASCYEAAPMAHALCSVQAKT